VTINFILPSEGNVPIGGFKIIYKYANRLSDRGNTVILTHTQNKKSDLFGLKKFVNILRYLKKKFLNSYGPQNWFPVNNNIKINWIPYLNNRFIPEADVVVATEWTTANPVYRFDISKGRKYYFIQSFESWQGPEELVIESWKLPLKKIVISKWLKEISDKLKLNVEYIPNGLDYDKFGMDILPEKKDKYSIMMLYNENPVKGSTFGLKAIIESKQFVSKLKAVLFGACDPPPNLPSWIKFYKTPDQKLLRKLYNTSAIFISPSFMEGFPLPPAECMMCGSALVATNIGGHQEYAINGVNSLLSPPGETKLMSDNLVKLINDDELRYTLAYRGHKDISIYKWDSSVDKLEKYFAIEI